LYGAFGWIGSCCGGAAFSAVALVTRMTEGRPIRSA